MKYLNRADKKTREIVDKFSSLKFNIKQEKLLNKTNVILQEQLALKLLNLPRASGLTLPKNRCLISCKGRAVLRRFRLTHTTLREEYPKGVFPGLYKRSF